MNHQKVSRRTFLKSAALFTAGLTIVPSRVLGGTHGLAPSDQINLGVIGCGTQARHLTSQFMKYANITAVCDVDSRKMQYFYDMINNRCKEQTGKELKGLRKFANYKELLAQKDIDGVIIATPDHWHAIMCVDACKAGKDIYVEKPMTHGIEEGRIMQKAVEKYGRVLQVGNMQRSWPNFRRACELVRNGYIGDIKHIQVAVGTHYVPYNLPEEPMLKELDWDKWTGPSPLVHYNSRLAPPLEKVTFPDWRLFKEFAGGMVCDWGAHMFDIAQWGMGMDDSGPVEFYPADGKEFKFVTMKYANGTTMTHEPNGIRSDDKNSVRFIGTNGVIDISRAFFDVTPNKLINIPLKKEDKHLYESENHYIDFIYAMRSRKQPISTVEIGHRTATLCHLVNFTYEFNRPLRWDPVAERFVGDDEANKRLHLEYRPGYKLEL